MTRKDCTCLMTENIVYMRKADPTGTYRMRVEFTKELEARFDRVKIVAKEIVREKTAKTQKLNRLNDSLVQGVPELDLLGSEINRIMISGLAAKRRKRISNFSEANGYSWSDDYVEETYIQGITRGKKELDKAKIAIAVALLMGFEAERVFKNDANQRMYIMLRDKVRNEITGYSGQLATAIRRNLSQGMINGFTRKQITDIVLSEIEKIQKNARIMARQEIVRTNNIAVVETYRLADVKEVSILAEWVTAGGSNVCSQCESLEGALYPLDVIETIIPIHPGCRCFPLPIKKDK